MTASTHDTRATLAEDVLSLARDNNINLVTAESCTGGLIIAALTDIMHPGISTGFKGDNP